jgi:hypothetical protein
MILKKIKKINSPQSHKKQLEKKKLFYNSGVWIKIN